MQNAKLAEPCVYLLTEQLCKSNNGRRNASPTIEKYEKAVGEGSPLPKISVMAAHPSIDETKGICQNL